jgi:hypothetical protein
MEFLIAAVGLALAIGMIAAAARRDARRRRDASGGDQTTKQA